MMKLKKNAEAPQKVVGDFSIKGDDKGKQVVIEGFANKAVSDRIGDLIPPEAWELDNFIKNPIIFFNHDRNIPIGKAIDVKVTDEGLRIKVRISKSDQAPIPYIRDMIEEGILKTFSVGFDDHESAFKSEDGGSSFKRAELLETSVVTIPMNQESDFNLVSVKDGKFVSTKIKANLDTWKSKSYEQVVLECLSAKGAHVAAVVKTFVDLDPEENAEFSEKYKSFLTGEEVEPSEAFLAETSEKFKITREELEKINKFGQEEEEEEEEKAKEDEEEEEEEDKQKAKEEDEEEDEEKSEKADFQECVAGKIPKFMEDGMERDKAIAAAISACQEGKSCDISPSKEDLKGFCDIADKSAKAEDEEDEESEEEEEEAKKKQADTGEGQAPGAPIDEKTSEFDIGQPSVDLQKSSLALQGSLLTETKMLKEAQLATNELLATMLEVMKNGPAVTVEEAKEDEEKPAFEDEESEEDEEDEEKAMKQLQAIEKKIEKMEKIQAYHDKLNQLMASS